MLTEGRRRAEWAPGPAASSSFFSRPLFWPDAQTRLAIVLSTAILSSYSNAQSWGGTTRSEASVSRLSAPKSPHTADIRLIPPRSLRPSTQEEARATCWDCWDARGARDTSDWDTPHFVTTPARLLGYLYARRSGSCSSSNRTSPKSKGGVAVACRKRNNGTLKK